MQIKVVKELCPWNYKVVYCINGLLNSLLLDICVFFVLPVQTRIGNLPRAVSAIKGTTVSLPCRVIHDRSVEVAWRWFVGLAEVLATDARLRIDSDGTLHITSIRNTDISTYSCVVTSLTGNDSATVDVTVIGKQVLFPITHILLWQLFNISSFHLRLF